MEVKYDWERRAKIISEMPELALPDIPTVEDPTPTTVVKTPMRSMHGEASKKTVAFGPAPHIKKESDMVRHDSLGTDADSEGARLLREFALGAVEEAKRLNLNIVKE